MKPEKTYSQSRLYDQGFNFAKLQKNGLFVGCKNRRGATHFLDDTKISVVATPLKRWPKHKPETSYGKPRYPNMQLPTTDKLEISELATHLMYSTSRVAIIATVDAVNDFMHMRGRLQFGTYNASSDRFTVLCNDNTPLTDGTAVMPEAHRTMKHVVREPEIIPAAKLPKPPKAAIAAAKPAAPRAPRAPGGESVCGYIDSLIIEGGRTKDEVLALVLAKFPGRDAKATMSTIGCRPSHIKAAGKVPQPFAK